MGSFLFEECCPECGHILPNNRSSCVFCSWSSLNSQSNNPMDELYTIDELYADGDFSFVIPENKTLGTQAIV